MNNNQPATPATPTIPKPDSSRPLVGVAVFLFIALLGVAAWKGSRDLAKAQEREHLLETRIEETTERIEELRGRIDRLRTDPGTLERRAREDLGMVRPGDVIIELPLEIQPEVPSGAVTARTPRPQ